MTKFYAAITNFESGNQFEIGANSKKDLMRDLNDIQRQGFEDLDKCSVHIYTVEC